MPCSRASVLIPWVVLFTAACSSDWARLRSGSNKDAIAESAVPDGAVDDMPLTDVITPPGDVTFEAGDVGDSGIVGAVPQVAVSDFNTCVVRRNGELRCSGENFFGQLGIAGLAMHSTSVASATDAIVDVCSTTQFTCYVTLAGSVYCAGDNSTEQLGVDRMLTTTRRSFDLAPGVTGARKISCGPDHACVITSGGGVQCWGDNTSFALGIATVTTFDAPQTAIANPTGTAPTAVDIVSGVRFNCARMSDKTVRCWGTNGDGQIGNGTTTAQSSAIPVAGIADAEQIAAGSNHVCVRRTNGTVSCWGDNSTRQLGLASGSDQRTPTAVTVLGADTITDLAAGGRLTCALNMAGQLRCFGRNTSAQLGNGLKTPYGAVAPTAMVTGSIRSIAVGAEHVCVLKSDDSVSCWGSNAYGQLSTGDAVYASMPVRVDIGSPVATVDVGEDHVCAATTAGVTHCWGGNLNGQTGHTVVNDQSAPSPVIGLTLNAVDVVAGNQASCARSAAGQVYCWGMNADGQLGDRSIVQKTDVTQSTPTFNTGALSVSMGAGHVCARVTDPALMLTGAMMCWGNDGFGALGENDNLDGADADRSAPVRAQGTALTGVLDVAAGWALSCAVKSDNSIGCWGGGFGGEFGGGSRLDRALVAIPAAGASTRVVIGVDHVCSLRVGGTVACWGQNGFGQSGSGMTSIATPPNPVLLTSGASLTGITAVSAGENHTCALRGSDGTVWCWGFARSGQLGQGMTPDRSIFAVQVTGLTGMTRIAAGGETTCALNMAGELSCWGWTGRGQIPTLAGTSRLAPVNFQ